jgi:transposase
MDCIAGKLVKRLQIPSFKHGIPGDDWFQAMKRRHPDFVLRTPESTSTSRMVALSPVVIDDYFDKLATIITPETSSDTIWNMDETNFRMEHKPLKVCARKGAKVVPAHTSNSRESVSVVACINAAGAYMPPMIIVKGKSYRARFSWEHNDTPKETQWAHQANAYMTEELGLSWFTNLFLKHCGDARPQVLILDGHKSHTSLDLLVAAREANISLVTLPPHSTHILQPLDRAVFKSMKSNYNRVCSDHMSQSLEQRINHQTWPALFCESFNASMTQYNIKSSFRVTGIYPLNRAMVSTAAAPNDVPIQHPVDTIVRPVQVTYFQPPHIATQVTFFTYLILANFKFSQMSSLYRSLIINLIHDPVNMLQLHWQTM